MAKQQCFLDSCGATVGDCQNPKCKCLVCLGTNKKNCATLRKARQCQKQQIMCDGCKHHNMNVQR